MAHDMTQLNNLMALIRRLKKDKPHDSTNYNYVIEHSDPEDHISFQLKIEFGSYLGAVPKGTYLGAIFKHCGVGHIKGAKLSLNGIPCNLAERVLTDGSIITYKA